MDGAVTEELIVVAVPVLLLRAAGVRTRTIVTVTIAARLAYHLYYGLVTLGLIVWAATALAIYLRLGLLWPLIAEHLVFDACAALDQAGYVTAGIALRLGVWFALALFIAGTYLRGHRHRQRMLAAAIAAGAQQRWEQTLGELTEPSAVTLTIRRWQIEPATTRLDTRHHTYQVRVGAGIAELTPEGQQAALAVEAARIHLGHIQPRRRQKVTEASLVTAAFLGPPLIVLGHLQRTNGLITAGALVIAGAWLSGFAQVIARGPAARLRQHDADAHAATSTGNVDGLYELFTWDANHRDPFFDALMEPTRTRPIGPRPHPTQRRRQVASLSTPR